MGVVRVRRPRRRPAETHGQIGVSGLRRDVRAYIRLALLDLGAHLLFAVAALGHITLNLPGDFEFRLGIEPYRNVEETAQRPRIEREQTLRDHDFLGNHRLRSFDRTVLVIVDRLTDRLAVTQRPQIFFHRGEVIRPRVERRQADGFALLAIESMVIVQANRFDPLGAEDFVQSPAERRFSGS